MKQIILPLPALKLEIEKPGEPKKTIMIYRMIYKQSKSK